MARKSKRNDIFDFDFDDDNVYDWDGAEENKNNQNTQVNVNPTTPTPVVTEKHIEVEHENTNTNTNNKKGRNMEETQNKDAVNNSIGGAGTIVSGNNAPVKIGDDEYDYTVKGNNNTVDNSRIDDHSKADLTNANFSNGGTFVGNGSTYSNTNNTIDLKDEKAARAYASEFTKGLNNEALVKALMQYYEMQINLLKQEIAAKNELEKNKQQVEAEKEQAQLDREHEEKLANAQREEAEKQRQEAERERIAKEEEQKRQLQAEREEKEAQRRFEEKQLRKQNRYEKKQARKDRQLERLKIRAQLKEKAYAYGRDLKVAKQDTRAEVLGSKYDKQAIVGEARQNRIADTKVAKYNARAEKYKSNSNPQVVVNTQNGTKVRVGDYNKTIYRGNELTF